MAVLPPASGQLLPQSLRDLMTDPHSILIPFYPTDFETDMNGKLQDWEALVLIPFIDQRKLKLTMDPLLRALPTELKNRNTILPYYCFQFSEYETGMHCFVK